MQNNIAEILEKTSGAMRLRELQVLSEVSKEQGSMIIVYPYGDRPGQEIAHSVAGQKNHK